MFNNRKIYKVLNIQFLKMSKSQTFLNLQKLKISEINFFFKC